MLILCVCMLRNKSRSGERVLLTLFLFVHSCRTWLKKNWHITSLVTTVAFCKAGFLGGDAARTCSVSVGYDSGTCNAGFAGDDVLPTVLPSIVDRSNLPGITEIEVVRIDRLPILS